MEAFNRVSSRLGTTDTVLLTVPAAAGNSFIVIGAHAANILTTLDPVFLDVTIANGSDVRSILDDIIIPKGSTLDWVNGSKIVLIPGDVLKCKVNVANGADMTISYMAISPDPVV